MMRVLSVAVLLGVLSPVPGFAQTLQEALQGQWACHQDIASKGKTIATYRATLVYSGKKVSGTGTLTLDRVGELSVSQYTARVRVRNGMLYETNHRIKRVKDTRNGEKLNISVHGASFSERHIPTLFPAAPTFTSANSVTWTTKANGATFECKRS